MKEIKFKLKHIKRYEHKNYYFDCFYDSISDTINLYINHENASYSDMVFCIGFPIGANNETISSSIDLIENYIRLEGDLYIQDYMERVED